MNFRQMLSTVLIFGLATATFVQISEAGTRRCPLCDPPTSAAKQIPPAKTVRAPDHTSHTSATPQVSGAGDGVNANEIRGFAKSGTIGNTQSPALKGTPYSPQEVSKRQSETRRHLNTGNADPDSLIPNQGSGKNLKQNHSAKPKDGHDTGERNVNRHEEHSRVPKGNKRQ